MKKNTLNAVLVSSSFLLGACAGTPDKIDSLEAARSAYLETSSKNTVAKHAANELDEARDALSRADKIWRDDGKENHVDHYAYVATQKVEIAELIAQRAEDDAKLEQMNLERQRAQLDVRSQEVDQARAEALALQQQLTEMQAKVTARGIVATLGDLLFDSGKAGLKDSSMGNIQKIANFMVTYPERNAVVEGHTDNMGDDDFNYDLSRERAYTVKSTLISLGVDQSRITTKNLGESTPVADNNTRAGRQKNRRVEVIFPDLGGSNQ